MFTAQLKCVFSNGEFTEGTEAIGRQCFIRRLSALKICGAVQGHVLTVAPRVRAARIEDDRALHKRAEFLSSLAKCAVALDPGRRPAVGDATVR